MYVSRLKYVIILLLLTFGSTIQVTAQISAITGSESNMGSTLDKVDVEVKTSMDTLKAGSEASFAVIMNIEDGWHLNAHSPTLDYLIGVELEVEASNLAMVSDIQYPEPLQMSFAFAPDELLDVYEGRSPILLKMQTSGQLEPGNYEITGNLQIQACSDDVCLPPTSVELSFPFTAGNVSITSIHTDLFDELENRQVSGTVNEGSNQIASLFSDQGYFWAFLSIFFIGLALNLTPCVYPMMSVTVSLFGGNENDRSTSIGPRFISAFVYVMGIVSMYSILGVVAAFTGGLFGSWLQSPWVLAGIGGLLLLLSLSMFGLYELQPPYWLMQKLGTARQAAGHAGHFLSGLLVGIFAAPCIGPPIIALLAFVGAQGSPVFGFFAFFIMALGLGIPYLFLGTFSGMLNKLPKSGAWMNWVKKVFGVILVGVALFYLSLAFMPGYSMHIILVTVVLGGIYLGFIERSGNHKPAFVWFKIATGIGALIIGFMLFQNLQKEGIEWKAYDAALVEQAQMSGTPVMLDFYADWCIPCLELDRRTFTNKTVIAATDSYVRMKVDLTHFDSEEAEMLRQQYRIAGVPTILFLDSDGNEVKEARVVGFLNPGNFLKKLEKVEKSHQVLNEAI